MLDLPRNLLARCSLRRRQPTGIISDLRLTARLAVILPCLT